MKPVKLISIKSLTTHRDHVRAGRAAEAAAVWGEAFATRAVADLLSEINGRAAAHTLGQHDVGRLVVAAEKRLAAAGVTVANRAGTTVTMVGAVPTTKAYARQGRSAVTTQVTIRRGTGAWYLDAAAKVDRYAGPGDDEKVAYTISAAAKDDVVRAALDGFKVAAPVAVTVTDTAGVVSIPTSHHVDQMGAY